MRGPPALRWDSSRWRPHESRGGCQQLRPPQRRDPVARALDGIEGKDAARVHPGHDLCRQSSLMNEHIQRPDSCEGTRLRFPPGPLLRRIDELDDPGVVAERVQHVTTARVCLVNYEIIQHDFPFLAEESL